MGECLTKSRFLFLLSFIAGLFVVGVSVYGFLLLRERPGIPGDIDRRQIVRIDNVEIQAERDEEYVLRTKKVGDLAEFYLKVDGRIEKKVASVARYYSKADFPLLYFIIGLFCFFIGTAVFLLRPQDLKARLFYWAILAFASAVVISGDDYCLGRQWPSFLPCLLFILAYAFVPALMLNFSRAFGEATSGRTRLLIFIPPILIAGAQESMFLYAFLKPSIEVFRYYQATYFVFLVYVIIYVFFSVAYLWRNYRRADLDEEKAQIKWIFYGLIVGLSPFIFLYQIPRTLGIKGLISEDVSTVFFIVIPSVFAIAIFRYKLMHIELVINRSLVYSLLTVFIVSLYLIFVQIMQKLFSRFFVVHEMVFSAIGVFLAAAVFRPAQTKIQDLVDKAFFRQRYDYRQTVLSFNSNAQRFVSRDELSDYFLREIKRIIPLETFSLVIRPESWGSQTKPPILVRGDQPPFDVFQMRNPEAREVFARRGGVQTTENIDFSQEKILEGWKKDIALPLTFPSGGRQGFFFLGKKKSGGRFNREDVELIRTMASELSLNLDRLGLQEEVIYERASKEKLDELNRLKTEFISSVSHELRTPMSSIQGLAEILQSGKVRDKEKREEFLGLMVAESSRLSRFIHNILDFGRIEQGAQSYQLRRADLATIVREVIAVFQPALDSLNFHLDMHLPRDPCFLAIDQDAVKQALINLVDNAIKYSAEARFIFIGLREGEHTVEIEVRDRGIGIPDEEQARIFDKFYRVPQAEILSPKGAGLGLKIVKHIMAAHQGSVRVRSGVGMGSSFTLVFPKP